MRQEGRRAAGQGRGNEFNSVGSILKRVLMNLNEKEGELKITVYRKPCGPRTGRYLGRNEGG